MVLIISTFFFYTCKEHTWSNLQSINYTSLLIFDSSKDSNLFDGLLNFLQVDVFGFPQQSILIHF